jgi:Nuclease-related domain
VRGYSALSGWAAERLAGGNVGILRTTRDELVTLLTRLSLTETQAMVFLDAVSFGRTSRDLFDAPLVRASGEWLLIGPATASPRLARIIPSLLASKRIQLKRKGRAFEERVLAFLKRHNLDARHIRVWREGAEYEFDVVALWERKLFLFECKNHGLSGNDPVEAYHFLQEIVSNARQVQRLVKALARWPEIVSDAFGANAEYDEVVPCILENETYSLPVQVDGVYVYDWSALTRFFKEGSFGVSRDHRLPGNHIERNRVQIKRIWSGDAPVANDLIAEMQSPYQFAVLAQHVSVTAFDFIS